MLITYLPRGFTAEITEQISHYLRANKMRKAALLWRLCFFQSSQKAASYSIEWAVAISHQGRHTQVDNLELLLPIDPPVHFD